MNRTKRTAPAQDSTWIGNLLGKTIQVGNYFVTVERKLGEGGFAEVYQVVSRSDSSRYALKHFRINGDQKKLDSVKAECILMKKLKTNPHILTLYAACFAGDPIPTHGFCLLELCNQDLVKALTVNHRHMTESDIIHIFGQVCQGLAHMHSQDPPIAHWDLKGENILQSSSGRWVLCDFGSAQTIDMVPGSRDHRRLNDLVQKMTTAVYRAPELYNIRSGQRISTKVDIFSLGVLLYLMCFGRFPFEATATKDVGTLILQGRYTMPPSHHSQKTRALIATMLTTSPDDRPDIHQVLATLYGTPLSSMPSNQASLAPHPHRQQQHGWHAPAVGLEEWRLAAAAAPVAVHAAAAAMPVHADQFGGQPGPSHAVPAASAARPVHADQFGSQPGASHAALPAPQLAAAYNPFGPADPFSPAVAASSSVLAHNGSGESAAGATAAPKVDTLRDFKVWDNQRVTLRGQQISPAPMAKDQAEAPDLSAPAPAAESPVLMPQSKTSPFASDNHLLAATDRKAANSHNPASGHNAATGQHSASAPDNPYATTGATPTTATGAAAVAGATASSSASPRQRSGSASATCSGSSAAVQVVVDSKLQAQEATTGGAEARSLSSSEGLRGLQAASSGDVQGGVDAKPRNSEGAPLTLSEALAALQDMTEQRDSLKQRLEAALAELELRRVRVAEMRSVIEALSDSNIAALPASARGHSTAPPAASSRASEDAGVKEKWMKSFFWDANNPGRELPAGQRVSDYVREGLDNCEATASTAGGLRRFNSDVAFNWDHALSLASSGPGPKAAAPV